MGVENFVPEVFNNQITKSRVLQHVLVNINIDPVDLGHQRYTSSHMY